MISNDLRHQEGNLVRGIEFACLLARVCGKHADEIFIDEAKHVIALTPVHGNILDQIQQSADRLGLRTRAVAQLGKPGFQRIEDFFKHALVGRRNQTVEGRKGITDIGHIKVFTHPQPCCKEITVRNEIAYILLNPLDGFFIVFGYSREQFIIVIICLEEFDFLIRQIFVEDKA